MTDLITRNLRRCYPWLAAGTLLQVGGCMIDTNALAAGLVQSIVNTFIADLIFGVFNVGGF